MRRIVLQLGVWVGGRDDRRRVVLYLCEQMADSAQGWHQYLCP